MNNNIIPSLTDLLYEMRRSQKRCYNAESEEKQLRDFFGGSVRITGAASVFADTKDYPSFAGMGTKDIFNE